MFIDELIILHHYSKIFDLYPMTEGIIIHYAHMVLKAEVSMQLSLKEKVRFQYGGEDKQHIVWNISIKSKKMGSMPPPTFVAQKKEIDNGKDTQ